MGYSRLVLDYRLSRNVVSALKLSHDYVLYITEAITVDDKRYLRSVEYEQYLYTLYWQLVRQWKAWISDGVCEKCGSDNRLTNVHHLSYDHRGEEYKHAEDIILLCKSCHNSEHDLLPDITDMIAELAASKRCKRHVSKNNLNYDPHAYQKYVSSHGEIK